MPAIDVLNLPLKTEVMIWREKKGWTGPYEIMGIDGRNITVHLDNGPLTVRWTHVREYHRPTHTPREPHKRDRHSENYPHEEVDPNELELV